MTRIEAFEEIKVATTVYMNTVQYLSTTDIKTIKDLLDDIERLITP